MTKLEVLLFIGVGLFAVDTYYDNKYTKQFAKYKKQVKIAAAVLTVGSLALFMRKNPGDSAKLLGHLNGMVQYMPIDKNSKDFITPFFASPRAEQTIQTSGVETTSRSVSGTKKKYVAASQQWKCGECNSQLDAWFEVDHKARLADDWILVPGWQWFEALRFWSKVGVGLLVAGITTLASLYATQDWGHVISGWFRSSDGVEVTSLTVLAVLALINWKFPVLFYPIFVACFVAVLLIFIFEFNKSPLERQGQNHWATFSIFVLPLLPVMFTFFEYANKIVHAVSTSIYLCLIGSLMGTNPNGVFEPRMYTQGSIYVIALLILMALVAVIFNKDVLSLDWSVYLSRMGMLFVTLAALGVAVSLAIKFFGTNPTWSIRYLIMLLILVVAGAVVVSAVWKRIPHKSYFAYFSTANLALKYVVLLSCYFSDLIAMIVAEPLQTWTLLLVEAGLIAWYFLSKNVFVKTREGGAGGIVNPTGMMLRNEPLNLQYESTLPISHNFKYNYAISCWINLASQPPNASPEATGFTNLVSYGGRPAVTFNASTNTLRVTMKSPGGKAKGGLAQATKVLAEFSGESLPSEQLDFSGPVDILIADIPDVALQKWIHLVFFHNSNGMLDIFINGDLYKSVAAVVTNESSGLTVGAYKGNGGKIANVMFFQGSKKPNDAFFLGGDAIDASTVHTLYNDFKSRDPPTVNRIFPVTFA